MISNLKALEQVAEDLDNIGLQEAENTKLESRVDTKYIFHTKLLPTIISSINKDYSVVNIHGKRWLGYANDYFDTKDYRLYNDHHSGKLNRIKIRIRTYDETKQRFLEIKSRSNNGRTNKIRIQTFSEKIDPSTADFIHKNTQINASELYPALLVKYKRMTLISKLGGERITIDTDLWFSDHTKELTLNGLTIIEVKQYLPGPSVFKNILKQEKIHPESISKYCIGISNLVDDVKHNAFKEQQQRIKTISEHGSRIN